MNAQTLTCQDEAKRLVGWSGHPQWSASQAIYLTLEIAADTSPSGETLVKLLPLVLAAVWGVVASVPTMAVATRQRPVDRSQPNAIGVLMLALSVTPISTSRSTLSGPHWTLG